MFRACRQFQNPLISFNVKSQESTIYLVNRTKKFYSVTILLLEWFLFTTATRRYVLNESKSFVFSIIRVFAFLH